MDQLNFQQIYSFMAAVEEKSFSGAAERLFITQSSLSKQIRRMEESLGLSLFARSNTGVVPTKAGEYLYNALTPLVKNMETAVKTARDMVREEKLCLTVGLCDSMSIFHIQPFLERLSEDFPGIDIRIENQEIEQLSKGLAEKKFDLVFLYSVWKPYLTKCCWAEVTRTYPKLYFSAHLREKLGRTPVIEDFKDDCFIRSSVSVKACHDPLCDLPFKPKKEIMVSSLASALPYVASGKGVMILGTSSQFADSKLVDSIDITNSSYMIGTDAAWTEDNRNPALLRLLQYIRGIE